MIAGTTHITAVPAAQVGFTSITAATMPEVGNAGHASTAT